MWIWVRTCHHDPYLEYMINLVPSEFYLLVVSGLVLILVLVFVHPRYHQQILQSMISYRHIYKNITFNTMKRKLFWQFLPFMILVIGGSFFIQEFVSLKYKYPKVTSYDLKIETKKRGIEMKKSRTLEDEYELIKTLDIDNWENVRIPRPWEDPNMTNK